jgi:phospholipase D1/2
VLSRPKLYVPPPLSPRESTDESGCRSTYTRRLSSPTIESPSLDRPTSTNDPSAETGTLNSVRPVPLSSSYLTHLVPSIACVIRDTDMIPSMMAGKPYQVGRFAHTMRVRLMQEHLGLDVDEIEAEEPDTDLLDRQPDALQQSKDAWDPDSQQTVGMDSPAREGKTFAWASRAADRVVGAGENIVDSVGQAVGLGLARGPGEVVNGAKVLLHGIDGATPETLEEDGGTHATKVVEGRDGTDGFASTVVPTLEEKVMVEGSGRVDEEVSTGMEHGRSMNQKERADGVSVVPPQRDDSVSSSASPGSTPASPLVNGAAQAPASSVSSPTVIHDTRQIPMEDDAFLEKDGDKIRPLAPITEQSEGRTVIHDAAPPSDTARSSSQDSSKSSPLLSKTDTTASSRPSSPDIHTPLSPRAASPDPRSPLSPGGSSRAKANEIAASRNAVTGSLRRNLQKPANPYNIPVPAVAIEPGAFVDPLDDSFYKDVWLATAVRNTQAFRKVFRCIPDDLVQTWKQYREFQVRPRPLPAMNATDAFPS